MQSSDCDAAKKSSFRLGITDVVLQKDLIESDFDFKSLENNLRKCFGEQYLDSRELSVFETGIAPKSIFMDSNSGQEKSSAKVMSMNSILSIISFFLSIGWIFYLLLSNLILRRFLSLLPR